MNMSLKRTVDIKGAPLCPHLHINSIANPLRGVSFLVLGQDDCDIVYK